jgi:deoxyribose-phosphate aldolase
MSLENMNAKFAKLFDHSIIRPDATREDVAKFAETAVKLKTATLTVQPHYIRFAAELLKQSGVLLGTVVGFPHRRDSGILKSRRPSFWLDPLRTIRSRISRTVQ